MKSAALAIKSAALILLGSTALGQTPSRLLDYALVLEDPPVARKAQSRLALQGAEAQAHLQKIRKAQSSVLAELARRKVRVVSAEQTLVNAVFVSATRESALELRQIPGVVHVQYLPPVKRDLNAAVNLVNASTAYAAVGGASNAGAGIKIGIIDTGIDQTHPGFQDPSLTPPPGFPIGDANFTNHKVIVARSYVSLASAGFTTNPVETSRPDDNSPRDRVGHGTGIAMIAAGVQNTGPAGTIQGIAPKAFLGNYKIFGSPGVNDFTNFAAINQALLDALTDRMDIVTLSISEGDRAFFGPFDVDPDPNFCGGQCDVRTQAVENAVKLGMVVVTSAGNGGGPVGLLSTTLSTITTPGTAPSGITVGASTNGHLVYQSVHVNGSGAPPGLQNIRALFGDGPRIGSPLTATLRDVSNLQNDGLACSALPAGSLNGAIALVQRGACFLYAKINNAQSAGAVGVILYQSNGRDDILNVLVGAQNTGIPAVIIGNADGNALKSLLASNPSITAALDPALTTVNSTANTVAPFSSRGPAIGLFANTADVARAIKPELVAPGDSIYTATQTFDPNGDVYNASGYTAVSGTSYAVPIVAGAVALVKQKFKAMTPAQLKSAVVNTATQDVTDGGATARVNAVGAGKLSIVDAVNVAATLEPATLAFGQLTTTTVSASLTLSIANVSNSGATFNFAVRPTNTESNASVQISQTSLTLTPNTTNSVTVSVKGNLPKPGNYEGFIEVSGAGPTLRVPYQYLVSDGVPANVFPIQDFFGYPNSNGWGIALRLVDQFGIPLINRPASFSVKQGKATITGGDNRTFKYGIAGVQINLGSDTGDQVFTGTAGGLSFEFDEFSRQLPTIQANAVVNAATFQVGQGMAPGSYISIFGTLLSDANAIVTTPSLPVSLASVSISFDGGGLSLPGHIHFVSPGQINVQIPWEFQGQSSVQMKVTYGDFLWSDIYTVPLGTYSPGVFAITDVPGAVISQSNPAKRGQPIIVYANGLGPVDRAVTSGDPSPAQPLAKTRVDPSVNIGGNNAQVIFSGLAPGSVGLYQVNVVVPADAQIGAQTMTISIGGIDLPVNLQVQ
jgi:minor extracellular serine protease Vpr